MSLDDTPKTSFALAYEEAEAARVAAVEAEMAKAERDAQLDAECHVYDPGVSVYPYAYEPKPAAVDFYEGTGIGALYGLTPMTRGLEAHLEGWSVRPQGVRA